MKARRKTDVVVYGGTAPGIVAAVRCAREGLDVDLVTPTPYLGGALPSLGAVETHYRGVRAPLLQEFIERIVGHYRDRYGWNSEQLRACQSGMMITFEPHVAESVLRQWIESEPRVRWWAGYRLERAEELNGCVRMTSFVREEGGERLQVEARSFVEASYEGDLMAALGVDYQLGRESRGEYQEPSAGRLFTRWINGSFPSAATEGALNVVTAGATTTAPLPESSGEGDDNVQSYSYRLCLTDEPGNRVVSDAPPRGYDRARFAPILLPPELKERLPLPFHHRFLIYSLEEMARKDHLFHGHALPNRKRSWNATNLTGGGKHYAHADASGRRAIEEEHRSHALGLMWFLQNDSEVPAAIRREAGRWGLARDEFVDYNNLPPQLYIREARRLVGRAVFSEHDALAAPGAARPPVHADSIAITEFSLDSLACTTMRLPGKGALCDGQFFQMEVSRPGQVSFGILLPPRIDNLLVASTVSATHVGWGTIRQTPTLMHLAESAAWAIVLAARQRCAPANVSIPLLQRTLVQHGVMISFFNDCDMASRESWLLAVQIAAVHGFFRGFDARGNDPLDHDTAEHWRRLGVAEQDMLADSGGYRTRGEVCERWFARWTSAADESQRRQPLNSP